MNISSSQIHSPLLGDKVDYSIQGCRTGPLAYTYVPDGLVRQLYATVNFIPQSGTKNWATGVVFRIRLPNSLPLGPALTAKLLEVIKILL
jgi:hypothetical protein